MRWMQWMAVSWVVAGCATTAPATPTPQEDAGGPASEAAAPVAAEATERSPVVATVAGRALTRADLDASVVDGIRRERIRYDQEVHELRERALAAWIDKTLIEVAAARAGVTEEQYVDQQLAGVLDPTDAEVKAFFDDNSYRLGGRDFAEVAPVIRDFLREELRGGVLDNHLARLRTELTVDERLPPFRVPVDGRGHARGPADAPVTIVMFSDFECSYCQRGAQVIDQVVAAYPERVRVVYRHFPLGNHPNARPAAEAAECAAEQGKFWEMHDRLFEGGAISATAIREHAKGIEGLNSGDFEACLESGRMEGVVDRDKAAGENVGVNGTPAFFVNGIPMAGAVPLDVFKKTIDSELAPTK